MSVVKLHSYSNLKIEEILLLYCARTKVEPDIENKIHDLIKKDLDWDYLVQLAAKHNLKPLLYWQINRISPGVPVDHMVDLKNYFNFNAQKNLFMLGELLKIVKLLASEDITVIPYKGPILASEIYGNIALREFDDLDFYIFREDVFKVIQILISESYEPEVGLELVNSKEFIKTQRELKFLNKDNMISIEIHWRFESLFLSLPDDQEILNRKNTFINDINGVPITHLAPDDLVLILSIHNAGHRWSRISWLSDINELVESKSIDWYKVLDKAENMNIQKILLINLALAEDLLGLEIPETLKKRYVSVEICSIVRLIIKRVFNIEYSSLSLLEEISYSFKLRDSRFYGIKDILNGLTNPTIFEWTSLHIPPAMWQLYYVYRPFNLIWRHKWR